MVHTYLGGAAVGAGDLRREEAPFHLGVTRPSVEVALPVAIR
jgi:hypothetical protein